ncbi:hypothetical protein FQZ97_793890 [compost metagenome]
MPAVVFDRCAPVGRELLVVAFKLQLAQCLPADDRQAQVFVFGREARAVVGAAAHTEHHALQRGFFHLHHHRRLGGRVVAGLQIDVGKDRGVVVAVGNFLLGVLQPGEAVVGAGSQAGQAHQAFHGGRAVALCAFHPHRADLYRRAGVELDVPVGGVRRGVDVAQAVDDAAPRVAFVGEQAQGVGLHAAPAGLCEILTHRPLAAALNGFALGRRDFGVRDVAPEIDVGRSHRGDRTRLDADAHRAQHGRRRAARGGGLAADADLR